ncbi:uncharacterized protein [Narcine bancroftii]|uniref:uncharacterized protein n=1 Tax=Narcine bancroftii TaxID=1343680 RepID=UPI00383201B8
MQEAWSTEVPTRARSSTAGPWRSSGPGEEEEEEVPAFKPTPTGEGMLHPKCLCSAEAATNGAESRNSLPRAMPCASARTRAEGVRAHSGFPVISPWTVSLTWRREDSVFIPGPPAELLDWRPGDLRRWLLVLGPLGDAAVLVLHSPSHYQSICRACDRRHKNAGHVPSLWHGVHLHRLCLFAPFSSSSYFKQFHREVPRLGSNVHTKINPRLFKYTKQSCGSGSSSPFATSFTRTKLHSPPGRIFLHEEGLFLTLHSNLPKWKSQHSHTCRRSEVHQNLPETLSGTSSARGERSRVHASGGQNPGFQPETGRELLFLCCCLTRGSRFNNSFDATIILNLPH